MGKRKQKAPQRSSEKQQCLQSWNMMEGNLSENSLAIVTDADFGMDTSQTKSMAEGGSVLATKQRCKGKSKSHLETCQFISDDLHKNFQTSLKSCLFYLEMKSSNSISLENVVCKFGEFYIQITADNSSNKMVLLSGISFDSKCWLYVSQLKGWSMLYFEQDNLLEFPASTIPSKKISFLYVDIELPLSCLEGIQMKPFQLITQNFNQLENRLCVSIWAKKIAFTQLHYPSECAMSRRLNVAMQDVMEYFYKIKRPDYGDLRPVQKHDIDSLYHIIGKNHRQESQHVDFEIQHPALQPTLRPYQKEAVRWMLTKEKFRNFIVDDSISEKSLHPLFVEIKTPDGKLVYYNKYGGFLTVERPEALPSPHGGILADEMGLGKTVEVLACMLLHPRLDLEQSPDAEFSLKKPITDRTMAKKIHSKELQTENKRNENKVSVNKEIYLFETITNHHICKQHISDHNFTQQSRNKNDSETVELEESVCSNDLESCQSNGNYADQDIMKIYGCNKGEDAKNNRNIETASERIKNFDLLSKESNVRNQSIDAIFLGNVAVSAQECKTVEVYGSKIGELKRILKKSNFENNAEVNDTLDNGNIARKMEKTEYANGISEVLDENFGDVCGKQGKDCERLEKNKQNETKEYASDTTMDKKTKKKSKKYYELIPNSQIQMPKKSFFNKLVSRMEKFECICGSQGNFGKDQVQCVKCDLWQHAACVNYNVTCSTQFLCPHCLVSLPPMPSGATLIVSPFSICHQWEEEIEKHMRQQSLKVFVYTGVQKNGFIQPKTLANYDIVITTYETLRKEVYYVDLPHSNSLEGRRFRHPKRFMAIPSPLIAVQWWRVCLDEAQMVECTTTKTAEMALRLSAINRWCVTGTPIQKKVDDLYGLFLFLGVDPYWVQQWWKKLLLEPFTHGEKEPMYRAVSQVLWRTSKKDVIDQIYLPQQQECVHWLTFSPVEEHFYRRQYHDCVGEAMKNLSKWSDSKIKLSSLDRQTMTKLLHPLRKLRQACCHPQAVRGEFIPIHKSTMTMEELLELLTKKAAKESEESHRQLVASLNGLAALHLIKKQYLEAVVKYREVLQSIEQHKDQIRTDDLQMLHALHNLEEILRKKPEGISPTLRDHLLKKQADELRQKYLAKAAAKVTTTQDSLNSVQDYITDIEKEFHHGTHWWLHLLQWVSSIELSDLLVNKVREDLTQNTNMELVNIGHRFRTLAGLEYLLHSQLTELESAHIKLKAALKKLSLKPTSLIINQTVECCLRPQKLILKICPFCEANELFNIYESKLFSVVERGVFVSGETNEAIECQVNTRRQGSWADGEVEKALKSIQNFCRVYRANLELMEYGNMHFKLFEALKKEFRALRSVWMALREQVSSFDELEMAITQLRLRLPDEPKVDPPLPNIIESSEFEQYWMKMVNERAVASSELRKKLGQLFYLKNLAKSQDGKGQSSNPDPCPICQRHLGCEWSVLQCGHCYCLDCIRIYVDQHGFGGRFGRIRCPVCRQPTHQSEISYVTTKPNANLDGEVSVKGSHSTKVEGIVQCLLKIRKQDPEAKALVFSTWQDVLDILAKALTDNSVPFRSLLAGKKFQKNLTSFRQENIMALLLPVHSGANGLNLTEATHVLLVEPILNPAQEQQAIGRIHRIGQDRATHVHKFLIRGTIEQRIYSLLKSVHNFQPIDPNLEETALTIGDLSSLFTEAVTEEADEIHLGQESVVSGDEIMDSEMQPSTSDGRL